MTALVLLLLLIKQINSDAFLLCIAASFSIRARGHNKLRHTSLSFCNFFYPSGRRRAGPSPARDALEMYLRRAARCRALTQLYSLPLLKPFAAVYAAAGLGAQLNSVSKGPS